MVMELKAVPAAKSLLFESFDAPLGKRRSSPGTGAVPPQFAASDQRTLLAPVHVRVAPKADEARRTISAEMANPRFCMMAIQAPPAGAMHSTNMRETRHDERRSSARTEKDFHRFRCQCDD